MNAGDGRNLTLDAVVAVVEVAVVVGLTGGHLLLVPS